MGVEPDAAVETTVTADRTVVEYRGTGDVAVVVRSAAGERVYLPLVDEADDGERDAESQPSPYGGDDPGASPYGGDTASEGGGARGVYDGLGDDATPYGGSETSPYGAGGGLEPGIQPTADGVRVVHPEPATDVRVLR